MAKAHRSFKCPFCTSNEYEIIRSDSPEGMYYQAGCVWCGCLGPVGSSARDADIEWQERYTRKRVGHDVPRSACTPEALKWPPKVASESKQSFFADTL